MGFTQPGDLRTSGFFLLPYTSDFSIVELTLSADKFCDEPSCCEPRMGSMPW